MSAVAHPNNGAALTNGVGLGIGLIMLPVVWRYGTSHLIPADHRLDLVAATNSAWQAWPNVNGYLAWLVPQLEAWNYPWAFLATAVPSVVAVGGVIAVSHGTRRSPWHALAGLAVGASLGFLASRVFPLPEALSVLAMPGLGFGLGVLAPMALAPARAIDDTPVLRGTRIVDQPTDTRAAVARAKNRGRTVLAGIELDRKAEVRHISLVGVTGAGKSVAMLGLMDTALARGDRMVVVDPDGSAMSRFWKPGDVILNPYDARSAKWDLLAEIREESDYQFLAETVIPFTGSKDNDDWVRFAQEIFTACLTTWVKTDLGSSDAFYRAMATATTEQLAKLTEGSPAHRYFAAEKMLASIMGTLAPALSNLVRIADQPAEPFSMRDWVRHSTTGTIWMPFASNQIASLRGLVSCWMRLAITETLTLPEDPTDKRRVWFHIDELDSLGRIQGLKDALVRVRKKGGVAVLGFQTISMVRAAYGEADAHAIVENLDNKLFLRCALSEGGGTARFASDVIGEREVERQETTTSRTAGQHPSSSTTLQTRRHLEKAVLPAELTQIPDRTGYLKLATREEWLKVSFDWVDYPIVTEPFVRTGPVRSDKAE